MDASKSKDSLRAAGKKRLEEFRLKRQQQQRGESKNVASDSGSAASINDESVSIDQDRLDTLQTPPDQDIDAVQKADTSNSQAQDVSEQSTSLEVLETELRVSRQEKEELLAERNSFSVKVQNLEAQLQSALFDGEAMKGQLESCLLERTELDSALAALREQVGRKEEVLQERMSQFEQLVSFIGNTFEEVAGDLKVRGSLESALDSIKVVKETMEGKEEERHELVRRVMELQEEKSVLESKVPTCEKELASLRSQMDRQREVHEEVVAAKNVEIEENLAIIQKLTKENRSAITHAAILTQKVDDLQQLESEGQYLKQKLDEVMRREEKSSFELQAVQGLLHEQRLENDIKEKEMEKLKHSVEQLSGEKDTLLSGLASARDELLVLRSQLLNEREEHRKVAIAKDEENSVALSSLTEEKAAQSVQVASLCRMVDELNSEVQAKEAEVQLHKKLVEDAKKSAGELQSVKDLLDQQQKADAAKLDQRDEEIQSLKEERDRLSDQLMALGQESRSLIAGSDDLTQQLNDFRKREEENLRELGLLKTKVEQEMQHVQDVEKQHDISRGEVAAENCRLMDQLTILADDLKACQSDLQTSRNALEESQKKAMFVKGRLLEGERELTVKSDTIDDLKKRLDESSALVSAEENRNRLLQERISALEQRLANSGDDMEDGVNRVVEELGVKLANGLSALDGRVTFHQESIVHRLESLVCRNEAYAGELEKERMELQTRLDGLERSFVEQTSDTKNLMVGVIEVPDELNTSLEGFIVTLIDKFRKADGELQRLRSQLTEVNEARLSERQQADEMKSEVTRLSEREQSLLDEISQVKVLNKQLRVQLEMVEQEKAIKVDGLSKECEDLRRRSRGLDETLTALKVEKDMAAQSMAKREAEVLETVRIMQKDLATAELMREQLQLQLEKSKNAVVVMEKEAQIAANGSKQLDEQCTVLNQKLADAEASLSTYKQQLAHCKSQIELLAPSCEEKAACIQKVEELIDSVWSVPGIREADVTGKMQNFAGEFVQARERASAAQTNLEEAHEKVQSLTRELHSLRLEKAGAIQALEASRSEFARHETLLSREREWMEAKVSKVDANLQGLLLTVAGILSGETQESAPVEESDILSSLHRSVNLLTSKYVAVVQKEKGLLLQIKDLERCILGLQGKTVLLEGHKDQALALAHELKQLKMDMDSDSNSLRKDLQVVTADRDRLEGELSESERKLATVREKLSLAIKKGKSVTQQRDDIKQLLSEKSEELERLNKQLNALRETSDERLEGVQKSLLEERQALHLAKEELDSFNSMLQAAGIKEKKLAAELEVLRRKCGETFEEKQLLEESRKDAWLELERVSAKLKEVQSSEISLKRTLLTMEESNDRLQKEISSFGSMRDELVGVLAFQSESLEKKMATFVDMQTLVVSLRQLLGHEDIQVISKGPSNRDTFENKVRILKQASLNTSGTFKRGLELVKTAEEVDLTFFLEESASIKQLLHESLTEVSAFRKESIEALEVKEQELLSCRMQMASKDQELESLLRDSELKIKQLDVLSERVEELEYLIEQNHSAMDNMETSRNKAVGKLTFTLGKFKELQQQCEAMLTEIETLQSNLDSRHTELASLHETVERLQKELEQRTETSVQLEKSLKALAGRAKGAGQRAEQMPLEPRTVVDALDAQFQRLQHENESLQHTVRSRELELQELRDKSLPAPSPAREIEELEQPRHISVPSAPHIRALKKPVGDQVAIDMDAAQIMDMEEKGNAFKSLGMIRFLPKATYRLGDRVDELCISAGKLLMRQPVARLSLIVYWIAIHVWIAATVTMAKI